MNHTRPAYAHAAGAAGAALLLYAVTLAPTTWFWDTSEYIATAHIMGIPHPPGNPLFVVVGRAWSLLLSITGLSVPIRINLLAAATSAVATGAFFLVAHRILAGWMASDVDAPRPAPRRVRGAESEAARGDEGEPILPEERWRSRIPLMGAWAGAILGASAFTVWNQSNVNEKVYTLSVLVIAVVSWLLIHWKDRKDEPGAAWLLVLAIYLMVLGSTNHLMSLLPGPAALLLVIREKPDVLWNPAVLTRSVAAVLLGLSFNFMLPLRSAQQPIINEGEPVCEGIAESVVAVYTLGKTGCPALAANLRREQYGKPPLSERQAPFGHQLYNYFQYFDWQWSRGLAASELPGNARLPFSLVFLGLGFWGLLLAWRGDRGHLIYMGTLAFTLTLALVYYLNFKYGYSLAPEHMDRTMREVRERDYFFIGSFHLWGFLAGMGLVGAWRWAAGGGLAPRNLALASPILVLAFVPLTLNWAWASRTDDHSARDWAYNMLQSVEPYGVLFTNGDNDTFPLWYLQEVEGIRQDVTVIVLQYLYTQWYPRQLNLHTAPGRQRLYDPEQGPSIYSSDAPPPTRPINRLADEELNRITHIRLPQDQTVTVGPVALRYPQGYVLGRGEQIALSIIRDSYEERPIHFASTGGLAQDLGLDRWVVRQGLTAQLRIGEPEEEEGVVQVGQNLAGELVDYPVSRYLADEVFLYRGLRERAIWADRATLNIPWHFYFLYLQLADAALRLGLDDETVDAHMDEADKFAVTAGGGTRGTP